jgi:phosphohistidine swiveling domain-containing protein
MNCQEKNEHSPALPKVGEIDSVIRSLVEQFSIVLGKPERVAECCSQLERSQSIPPSRSDVERLSPLLPILAEQFGPLVFPLYDLIERTAASSSDPWPLLKGMIAARDKLLTQRSLQCARQCIDNGSLVAGREVVNFLAETMDLPGKCLSEPACLPLVAGIVRRACIPGKDSADPVTAMFLGESGQKVRRMAACLLDSGGTPITMELAEKALGKDAFAFLAPYLAYTRASHSDVASLLPSPGTSPPALPSLRRAHADVGEHLVREIIAEAGWQRLNLSLEVRHYMRVSPGESLPLMLSPPEAGLAKRCGEIRVSPDLFLAVAHGGNLSEHRPTNQAVDPASRFRNYNLAHADVLADFLAVAPLTVERIRAILRRMDIIVGEFVGLFSSLSEECSILTGIYNDIKDRILAETKAYESDGILPPDLSRLTVMFEDPKTLGQVRTLHGLKRYLHQKGLQLGFKLVQRSLSTNRTVSLFLCSRKRIQQKVESIRYADFEPETDGTLPGGRIPYAVSVVADGFALQLLYGHENFPKADIFCYGNEIHYFLAFQNHPAFLRINYSPPLQGGMIDLEYYGVSKYELSAHPDFSLDALQRVFRSLGFGIQVENTRVHARYDKEQTPDLSSLCEKAEALFCLAPYLLDIDWTIGGLKLDGEARQKVAAAWAESFASWGVLPLRLLLTKNRQGIIESVIATPAGRRENAWSGKGAYRDRFRSAAADFFPRLYALAHRLDPDVPMPTESSLIGQQRLERTLLRPLRRAAARGELTESPEGYEQTSAELYRRMSEPEQFAELIASGDTNLKSAATLAYLVAPLERVLSFRTTGSVGYFQVQSGRLPLQDEDLGIHVMRGENRGACLAFYTHGTVLYQRRNKPSDPWESNAAFGTVDFLALLRRANYPVPGLEQVPQGLSEEILRIRENPAATLPAEPRRPIPGERTVGGLRASPGRAVGRVLFGTKGRTPEDFTGAVLVTAALQPHDGPFLNRAAGVVSTGGGILSHAALLAAQFHKPAIIIAGRWGSDQTHGPSLHYTTTEYELEERESHGFHICSRKQIRECEYLLREGDLIALDASEDILRILGHDPDALALHEGLRQFARAHQDLAQAPNDRDILHFRGRKTRARHQVEKVLTRLSDPILTCHALHEILLGFEETDNIIPAGEKAFLMNVILKNPSVAGIAGNHLRWLVGELRQRFEQAHRSAASRIPTSSSVHEVLGLRLDALRAYRLLNEAGSCLRGCGLDTIIEDSTRISEIDRSTRSRVAYIREEIAATLRSLDHQSKDARCRHLLRQWESTEPLANAPVEEKELVETLRIRLLESDEAARAHNEARIIIHSGDGGLELFPFVGWKAANLAEIARLTNKPLVPPWFAVTDRAFREILTSPADQILPRGAEFPDGAATLGKAIEAILSQSRLDRFQKSTLVRSLWDSVILPPGVAEEVAAAYREIGEQDESLVALRSSSHEEDAEIAARAGEFDTFLFIRGEKALLKYLLWTWSGLWSERALHTRAMLGTGTSLAGGGVIIQQIVNSRVSGVLQTVNVARNEFREIVINAGWGLGEGIVSGTVAADQITVSKEGDLTKGPLRFRYVTADKKEYVVFNKRAGFGTTRCEALYHQRLRPALEYSELCELVAVAIRLESAYGYPLDIEFAIEGSRLWILQVRPLPTSLFLLNQTLQNYPLTRAEGAFHVTQGEVFT